MKKFIMNDYTDIVDEIIEYCEDGNNQVVIVGSYDTLSVLFNSIIKSTYAVFVSGELRSPEWDGYDDAYYLEYNPEEIWLGKAMCDGCDEYIRFAVNRAYVEKEFVDKYIEVNDAENIVVFSDEDDESENMCLCLDEDCTGFTYCMESEFGRMKFKYKGIKKITEQEAWDIARKYM